jgi:predicted HTH transcriptional regulator
MLPSDDEFKSLDIFPYMENNQYEFKTNLSPNNRLLSTICAFLNSSGGYIICGIDDISLKIKGIDNIFNKDIDAFLLDIDTIYHLRKIITQDGELLNETNITTKIILQKDNKPVVIITIKPDENKKYKLPDGSVYYRVNASNYKVSGNKMLTEYEVNLKLAHLKIRIANEYQIIINTLQNKNKQLTDRINRSIVDNKKTEDLLFTRILNDKDKIQRKNMHFSFCCGIINFFFN